MEIERLGWQPANVAKLRAHGITRDEVSQMVFVVNAWVGDLDDSYPDQVRVIGPTSSGRFITIALDPTDDPVVWRPVTGWPSTDEEIAYHREEYR